MDAREFRLFDLFRRASSFWTANAAEFAPDSLASTHGGALTVLVQGVADAGADRIHGSYTGREAALEALRARAAAIDATARVIALGDPAFAAPFRMPVGREDGAILDHVAAMLQELAKPGVAEQFLQREMAPDFSIRLQEDHAVVGSHDDTAATTAVRQLLREGPGHLAELDVCVRNRYADQPRPLGAWAAACHAGDPASAEVTQPLVPNMDLGVILGDRRPVVQMPVLRYEDGMLPSDQALVLLSILVAEAPSQVLEIGTYMGHTTRLMAENLPHAVIHTVDLPESFTAENDPESRLPKDDYHLIARRTVGREFRGQECAARIRQHFADTASWDFQGVGEPTFFFIDGSHTYEYCRSDSERCLKLCGGNGVFLWHDCDAIHPGVIRFLAEWRALGRDVRRITGTPIAYWKGSA